MFGKAKKSNTDYAPQVLAIAERVMREQGIQRQPALEDSLSEEGLGLTSMARLELFAAIERDLGVTIPEDFWGTKRITNLDHLVKLISK